MPLILGRYKADLSILALLSTLPNAIAGYISGTIFVRKFGERRTVMLGFLLAASAPSRCRSQKLLRYCFSRKHLMDLHKV